MNENYDEEEDIMDEEEDYEDDASGYEPPSSSTRPPKTGNLFRDAGNGARQAGKSVFSSLGKMFLEGAKTFIASLVTNPYFIGVIVVLVLLALFWIAIADGTTKRVTSSVEDYIATSDTIEETAKALYLERHSLLLLKISEINEMYDRFMADKGNPGDIKTAMKTKMGLNEVESKKATQYNSTSSISVDGYDSKFKRGSDGVRDDERVKMITGSTNKISTYKVNDLYSRKDGKIAGVNVELVNITVPVWVGKYGSQTASTTTLQVNSIIKDIVKAMYEDIYNDPSKPVINSTHCFRNDQKYPGHAFAVAVDINPDQNPMAGRYGNMANYKPDTDKLSMDKNHPIVKIIRDKYGWDWGGDWSSDKDYMHFSFIGG